MLGVINYGSGNFRSVCNALDYLNLKYRPIQRAEEFTDITHIILPGVGSFKNCMAKLESLELINSLQKAIFDKKIFFLGICVGHQILSTLGTEFEETNGLNVIAGITKKIRPEIKLPIPHVGWSEVIRTRDSKLFEGIENGATFYFVHSYHIEVENHNDISSVTNYGCMITASVEKNNIFGVQFHPEKSQKNGLRLLENFSKL